MTTFEMMQSSAVLLLLTLIPGLLLSLSIRGTPRELISLLACSMGVSLAYLIPLGIGLLAAGAFNLALVVAGCLPLVALAAWRRHQFFRSLQALHIDGGNAASIVVVLGALAVALIATPHWSFLINVAWDAGNYETYSNHFWLNGRLSLNISDILARDLPVEWSLSGPTWVIPENREGLLEPSQLLGFPVYPRPDQTHLPTAGRCLDRNDPRRGNVCEPTRTDRDASQRSLVARCPGYAVRPRYTALLLLCQARDERAAWSARRCVDSLCSA